MNILIVNDDGIHAEGIFELARLAKRLGNVTVCAPMQQCSGKAHGITVVDRMLVRRETDFPVPGVTAYSVDGTPADAAMAGLCGILKEKPDFVFSGINDGYNTGIDALYSGTVGAAMEGLVHGVRAVAFSLGAGAAGFDLIDAYFDELVRYVLEHPCGRNEIYNLNFPACAPENLRGILYDCIPSEQEFYDIYNYTVEPATRTTFYLKCAPAAPDRGPEGTDMDAVLQNYIAVGKLKNMVIGE